MNITRSNVAKNSKSIREHAEQQKLSQAEAICSLFIGNGYQSGIPFYTERHLDRAARCLAANQRSPEKA